MLGCLLWLALAGAIWYGRTQLAPIFEDFDVSLSAMALLFVHPLSPLMVIIVGAGFRGGLALMSSFRRRYVMQITSVVTALVIFALAAYAYLRPLMILIQELE